MKSPSKNVSASLRGQNPSRSGLQAEIGRIKQGMSSGTIPGQRGVEEPPGANRTRGAAGDTGDAGTKVLARILGGMAGG